MKLELIYRDEHLVAINKPSGLLVHPSLIDKRETLSAMKLLRDQLGRWVYPVHRLDKPTSGVLLFALDPHTARLLSGLFEQHRVSKTYLAVVRGYTERDGLIDHPLREVPDKMTDRKARTDKPAQAAQTRYRRLATVELPFATDRYPSSRYSLLAVVPETGRKHQIRRHMKHIAHPIVGDTSYGKSLHNRLFQAHFGSARLLLSAVQMTLPHPLHEAPLLLRAPIDEQMTGLMHALGWRAALPSAWQAERCTDPAGAEPSVCDQATADSLQDG